MTSQSDREYLEQLAARIEQLGVDVEHRSNLISIASRLHHLRTRETDPREIEVLDFQLNAIMRVIDDLDAPIERGGPPRGRWVEGGDDR